MIRNILFDMGGVLLRFEPRTFIARLGVTGEDAAELERQVFHTVEWVQMDKGTLTEDEALASMCRRLPERLHAAASELVHHWDEPRLPMPGATELVRELSDKGYPLYLLSNAALRHHVYWPKLPMAPYFGDRLMVSADWHLLKPDPAFFQKALTLFGLRAEECLFIDDSTPNVLSAMEQGMEGVVFHGDMDILRRDLQERGVL